MPGDTFTKISALPAATAATLTNDEPFPAVQSGATVQLTGNKILTEAGFRGSGTKVSDLDALIRGVIQGLKLTRLSTTTFSVDVGAIGDSTFTQTMKLAATTTKSTSAWTIGSGGGGLDTGAIGANSWYAVFVIKRTDTEVVDVLFSLSATAPTMPANYTLFRRVGWVLTDGSSQFVPFIQIGRKVLWLTRVVDINAAAPASTTRNLVTLTTPVSVEAILSLSGTATVNATSIQMGATALADVASTASNRDLLIADLAAQTIKSLSLRLDVDASRQIFYRTDFTTGTTLTLQTLGWIDDLR